MLFIFWTFLEGEVGHPFLEGKVGQAVQNLLQVTATMDSNTQTNKLWKCDR
ncbi:MAG: hypothetical protein NWQ43_05015 [Dolichospermum sp.]|nr:hypothetical protein [Dolichospermum sp.]